MAKNVSNRITSLFFSLSVLAASSLISSVAYAANPSFCDASPTTVTLIETQVELSDSCQINSDLHITAGGSLLVNYSTSPANILAVAGDIKLAEDGLFLVSGGVFLIDQDFAAHRSITLANNSAFILENTVMRTNPDLGTAAKNMNLFAYNDAIMLIVNSTLERTEDWLLGNYYDSSQLIVVNSEFIPTETYLHDASTARIFGELSTTEVWLNFEGGVTGTIDLPDQTDGVDFAPYTWNVGRGEPGLIGINWRLEIFQAKVKLALGSHKESSVVVKGLGFPESGEVTIGYFISDGEETVRGLKAGVQNIILGDRPPAPPQLTLKNVNLGPVAWQVYAVNNGIAHVVDSVINETAALHAEMTIEDSLLQLAAVAAIGETSKVTITDSEIHSHLLVAKVGAQLKINSSELYGGLLTAENPISSVITNQGIFLPNAPPPGEACTLTNAIAVDGTINCNPFLPDNALVEREEGLDNFIVCDQTINCTWNP